MNATSTTPSDGTSSSQIPPRMHPAVAFIIGLSIILGASVMNAGGLNITKLDHSRQALLSKSSRTRDWLRPLWLLGMLLYILSQLVGSTLALEYMRAEYVAPLGSTSLIFNFLFASVLIGTPVTTTDIWGTVIIVVGVVGIVLFGSINSGLANEMDIARLSSLWGRAGWLVFFLLMSLALCILYICTTQLDAIFAARADLSSVPFAGASGGAGSRQQRMGPKKSYFAWIAHKYRAILSWIRERLEHWTAPKNDKQIAWTLGIGWACCGGGLAGGCLVFAKSCVKLISGSLSHQNTGNQFGHPAAIITFVLLGVTAVFQIICLNRGLRVYDSTLVVPVFYGIYTASGFLNSLIFNDQIDAYQPWALLLIFISIMILIGGVVLLTNKKPEKTPQQPPTALGALSTRARKSKNNNSNRNDKDGDEDAEEEEALRQHQPGEEEVVWQLGDDSDGEDVDHDNAKPPHSARRRGSQSHKPSSDELERPEGERSGLMRGAEENDDVEAGSGSSSLTRVEDEFGDWKAAGHDRS